MPRSTVSDVGVTDVTSSNSEPIRKWSPTSAGCDVANGLSVCVPAGNASASLDSGNRVLRFGASLSASASTRMRIERLGSPSAEGLREETETTRCSSAVS